MIKNSYIKEELKWLNDKLLSIRKYVDDNPIDTLKDRVITIGSGKSQREVVTATVEQILKSLRDSLKDLPPLLEAIDKLRERDESKKIIVRGKRDMPEMMK